MKYFAGCLLGACWGRAGGVLGRIGGAPKVVVPAPSGPLAPIGRCRLYGKAVFVSAKFQRHHLPSTQKCATAARIRPSSSPYENPGNGRKTSGTPHARNYRPPKIGQPGEDPQEPTARTHLFIFVQSNARLELPLPSRHGSRRQLIRGSEPPLELERNTLLTLYQSHCCNGEKL